MQHLQALSTTAIGSLPHTQLELALQFAFQVDIPYLPQLPARDSGEFMIPQALAGLPGLTSDADGVCTVDLDAWRAGRAAFQRTLGRAVAEGGELALVSPQPEGFAAWQPFLWELANRKAKLAKIHLAGPLTATRAGRLSDGRPIAAEAAVASQVFELILARALSMVAAVKATGAQPLFFLDEPGLCGQPLSQPAFLVALQELRLLALALRKAGAVVGLHCCGDAVWERLLPLGFDVLSIDAGISLASLLSQEHAFRAFVAGGGRLALGVVPTDRAAGLPSSELLSDRVFARMFANPARQALAEALLTPACGLALRTVPEAEAIFETLGEVRAALRARLALN